MDIRKKLKEAIEQYEDDDKMKSFIIDETLLGEDYPENFSLDDLVRERSYNAKIRYISQHLRKIGAGSAREVYYVDSTKVVKLAKNDKGVAQNGVEAQGYIQNAYSDIVARVYASDDNDIWLEMELAKKISPKRFKELTGLDFNEFGRMLVYMIDNKTHFGTPPQEKIDAYAEHPFAGELIEMAGNLSMPSGDFQKINSFGEVTREGHQLPVVVDYGFDEHVKSTHYAPKQQRRYY